MSDDRQERIRKRAHEIWESEGRPHGAHDRHWHQAAAEIDATAAKPAGSASKPAAKKKVAAKPAGKSAAAAKKPAKPRKA